MKRLTPLILLLASMSLIAGYLFSKMSRFSRFVAHHFKAYKQYDFLRTWWKGAIFAFCIFMVLLIMHKLVERYAKPRNGAIIHIALLIVAALGLYFTFDDFQHNFADKVPGEKFHLGGYLLWIGWMIISLFFLFDRKKTA